MNKEPSFAVQHPQIVLSLCDYTTTMVQPWLADGWECWCVDIQHPEGEHREGNLVRVGADINTWFPPPGREFKVVFAFPPCTDLAISGARWLKDKGLHRAITAMSMVQRCRDLAHWTKAPYFLENPVSTIGSYWRKPDYTFHPWHYTTPAESKKTCLWTGGGFVMPPQEVLLRPTATKETVWRLPPSPERANLRSATPEGFARAVWQANR